MRIFLVSILIIQLAAGCTSEKRTVTTSDGPQELENDMVPIEPEQPSVARLPGMYIEGSDLCPPDDGTMLLPETFDDYVSGASGLVVGTVEHLRPKYSPFVQLSPPALGHDTDSCESITPAVAITLRDVESLYGESHDEITVRVSQYIIQEWNAHFVYFDDDSDEGWIVSRHDPEAGIIPGMRIGIRYYEVDSLPGEFGTLSTPLFLVGDDDEVYAQELEESEFGSTHLCPGDAFFYHRDIDAVHTGTTLSTIRDGLADARARFASGERIPPSESTRQYIPWLWGESVREDTRLRYFGVARCTDIIDYQEWDLGVLEDWEE